jgi:hypothetical protein
MPENQFTTGDVVDKVRDAHLVDKVRDAHRGGGKS